MAIKKKMPDEPIFNTTATAKPTLKPLPNAPTYDTSTWDESAKGQAALGDYNAAKDKVNNYGGFTYKDYQESDAVKGAGNALNQHLANKPGEYKSQWQSQLDSIMQQIMNGEQFSYDMNGDALYQQHKDKFTQQGKMAMADTMGQAAAMTGGYGNSYAQSVGQQAYQGQLSQLNDVIPELAQMAYNRYRDGKQDLYNQYGMVADRDNQDYGRHRDSAADWQNERDYLQGRYDSERGFDYGKYVDDRNLAHATHQEGYQRLLDALGIARDDYYSGADMFHSEQSNKNNIAGQQFSDAMAIWGAESDQAWKNYDADETARRDANNLLQQDYQNKFGAWEAENNDAWEQKKFDESVRQHNETMDYTREQDALAQSNWEKQFGLSERELAMQEEAWQFEKEEAGYVDSTGTPYKGTTPSGASYDNGTLDTESIKEIQSAIGVDADGYWGKQSSEAAGGLSPEEAYEKHVGTVPGGQGTPQIPQKIIDSVQNYTTETGQANYLAAQVSAGIITEDQAMQILSEYRVVPFTERNWEMVDDGGLNWFWGVDNDAVVRDENGNEYTLKELRKELEKTMTSSEAKTYIKNLQKQLGI